MSETQLEQAVAEYAALEQEIGRRVAERFSDVCAGCQKRCCRAEVCEQALSSDWLRTVSRSVHGKWWPDDWEDHDECHAMTETGCLLLAGRPAICRSFVCDEYTEAYASIWEVVFYSFLADLPWEVCQVTGRTNLEEVDTEKLPGYAGRVLGRLADARAMLARAERLLDEKTDEAERHRIALELLCLMPRMFRATTRNALLARLGC